ncbi:MAG: hypothetical protein A2020_07240 [Lentisphaerae bacterium GWF2_45_14]|nr:MAG: hypothetical protein A2020_07240 [Lentisphaerae bacterium GWF2_45_14]
MGQCASVLRRLLIRSGLLSHNRLNTFLSVEESSLIAILIAAPGKSVPHLANRTQTTWKSTRFKANFQVCTIIHKTQDSIRAKSNEPVLKNALLLNKVTSVVIHDTRKPL